MTLKLKKMQHIAYEYTRTVRKATGALNYDMGRDSNVVRGLHRGRPRDALHGHAGPKRPGGEHGQGRVPHGEGERHLRHDRLPEVQEEHMTLHVQFAKSLSASRAC
eukprot:498722-Prymnesium_polylepis.1